jgi:hypothetical protein
MISQISLTVLFDNPFWIGVFEIIENQEFKVCKLTFGPEPREEETLELILYKFYSLKFSTPISSDRNTFIEKKLNPKRLRRKIQRQTNTNGVGTKAQIALKLQHEQCKLKRKQKSKQQKEQEEQTKFDLKRKKKLEKHKGH